MSGRHRELEQSRKRGAATRPTETIPVREPRRVLVYTHNSIGLGHAVRTMAVIDGIRRARPDLDWLVLSGTSVPQVFLNEGVEVLKLPGIRRALEIPDQPYHPRLIASLGLNEVLAWRSRMIAECLASFRPDVIMIEHSLAGLLGEAAPLLAARANRGPANSGPILVHLSRGIFGATPLLAAPEGYGTGLPPITDILRLYDAFFVLEDRSIVDINREFLGQDPTIEEKIHYLGRVASRNPDELTRLGNSSSLAGTGSRPFILVALGRHGRIADIHIHVLDTLRRMSGWADRDILVVPDPYLDPRILAAIKAHPAAAGMLFTSFMPHLVEVMARAELVICRAGYNTVNEVLLTGVRGLIIPEAHPSGEQERRAAGIRRDNVLVLDEEACLSARFGESLKELLRRPVVYRPVDFDRFRVGRIIAWELAGLFRS